MFKAVFAAAALVLAAALLACDAGPAATEPPEPPSAVRVSAYALAFEQLNVAAPADAAFPLYFENRENIPHNVAILDEVGATIAKGEVFTGPSGRILEVPALAAGQYRLICEVHPNMHSILVAGATP